MHMIFSPGSLMPPKAFLIHWQFRPEMTSSRIVNIRHNYDKLKLSSSVTHKNAIIFMTCYNDYTLLSYIQLRQGCRMKFFSIFLNLFVFWKNHNIWIRPVLLYKTFILDLIDQARNCPFRLSVNRWRHVR